MRNRFGQCGASKTERQSEVYRNEQGGARNGPGVDGAYKEEG